MSPEPTTVKRAKTEKVKILHIAGSPVSKYYSMISVHYARQMLASASDEKTRAAFDFTFAIVLPGGAWSIVRDLDEETIESAKKLSHGEAIAQLAAADFDCCVPHMSAGRATRRTARSWTCCACRSWATRPSAWR